MVNPSNAGMTVFEKDVEDGAFERVLQEAVLLMLRCVGESRQQRRGL